MTGPTFDGVAAAADDLARLEEGLLVLMCDMEYLTRKEIGAALGDLRDLAARARAGLLREEGGK
ncbi:MAG: hypothetical protein NUW21_13960 [Elusimicrobia bacterium]|nr:hypothetical protein [Elusimicrobiota bacterium]